MRTLILMFILVTVVTTLYSQTEKTRELYNTIRDQDSLLFTVGFNKCDTQQFERLLSDDFEFYHDKGGITTSKRDFIHEIKNGLCQLPYKAERVLDERTLEVFPLAKNNVLYGAVEIGNHSFYAVENENKKYLTSTAKFTHTWIIENGRWTLSRGISYDHQKPKKQSEQGLLFTDKKVTEEWLRQKNIPALGIGVITNGKIEHVQVFGNISENKNATLQTIWNVASLTKPITALVALKLIDMGKWNLDDPIYPYYVDKDIEDDPYTKKLTTRMLLSHQSGFPNWRKNNTNGKLSFEFEPGTKYKYSGEGYEYLRKALEKKFNKPFNQLADELVFKPLGMNDTRFFWDTQMNEERFAHWYNNKGEMYEVYKNKFVNAADDLLTTVEDYCKFMVYVMNGAGLSEKLQKEMTAQQVRINDYKHFGLGWWIDENINAEKDFAMVHGGDDIGVHTIAFIQPKTKQGLLIFTNCDNGTDAFAEILLHFLGKDGQGILDIEMKR